MPATILEFLNADERRALEQILVELVEEIDPGEPIGEGLHDELRDLVGRAAARRAIRAELGQSSRPVRGRLLDGTRRDLTIPGLPG